MATQLRWQEDPHFDTELVREIRALARPLRDVHDLDPLLQRIGDARIVMLGESTHGTSEYYAWRARISQTLIEKKGFSFVAVEGDWPDSYQVHRYIAGDRSNGFSARETLRTFYRWPTWMWANEEMIAFVEWLHQHNEQTARPMPTGFYGLDVYSLWESLHFLDHHLRKIDHELHDKFLGVLRCFGTYERNVHAYAHATLFIKNSCEPIVVDLLEDIRKRLAKSLVGANAEDKLLVEQNAWVLLNAEAYYRTMMRGGAESWNIRDTHMADTLERLLKHHGRQAKGIVWAHNTHIGDARYTDMADVGMTNLGEIMRERLGEDAVALVGFASHHGSVIAGSAWDAPWQNMVLPPARMGSWETHLHAAAPQDTLLIWEQDREAQAMLKPRGHRAVGVVYHPEREEQYNYVPTIMPRRYDALCYFDETRALHPLHVKERRDAEFPETFPSAV